MVPGQEPQGAECLDLPHRACRPGLACCPDQACCPGRASELEYRTQAQVRTRERQGRLLRGAPGEP